MHLNRHEPATRHTRHSRRTLKALLPKISPWWRGAKTGELMLVGLGLEKRGTVR